MKEIKLISSGLLLICLCLSLCQGTPVFYEDIAPEATNSNYTSDNETTTNEQDLLTNCVCSLWPTSKTQYRGGSLKDQQMEVRMVLTRTKEPYDQRNITVNVPPGVDVVGTPSETQNKTKGDDPATTPREDDGDWQRVFEDDFNQDGAVNGTNWQFDVGVGPNGDGWGNNELQYYTDNRLENAHCQDGHLSIEARKEDFENRHYTSAKLKSKQSFLYGRLQIRAKVPSGTGSWSALWMLPESKNYGSQYWPDNGEINLMEQVGFDPLTIVSSVHTQANNHMNNNQPTASFDVNDATTQYNIYTLIWDADKIEMFVGADGATALQKRIFIWEKGNKDWTQWPFDKPFYIIMNVAVGGNWAGQEGIDESAFPQKMEIDWVHFDQKK